MKHLKQWITAVLVVLAVLCLIPIAGVGATETHENQVRVIVENNTYSKSDGAAWDGVLVDKWVDLNDDSTMMTCVVDALGSYSQTGADSNYISEINGLKAMDGGSMSGWMGTLNDWFTNEGFGGFTVAAGTLQSGDQIAITYSVNMGEDLGSSWGNNTKTLQDLTFSAGALNQSFDSSVNDYTLTVPKGTASVLVTPTAANKNFLVKTFVGDTEYKRTSSVPVQNGTVIKVTCGDPSWPSMNNQAGGTGASVPGVTYNIKVVVDNPDNHAPALADGVKQSEDVKISANGNYSVNLDDIFTDADQDNLTYSVSVNDGDAKTVDADYTYSDGSAKLVFTASDGYAQSESYTVNLTKNTAPKLKDGVGSSELLQYKAMKSSSSYDYLKVDSYFDYPKDSDGDTLTYYVSIDGADPVELTGWGTPSQTIEVSNATIGTHSYALQAYDGTDYSPVHTIAVAITAASSATVTPAAGQPVYLNASNNRYYYFMDDKASIQLKADVSPASADQTVTWSVSSYQSKYLSVDQTGKVTFNKENIKSTIYPDITATTADGQSTSFSVMVVPANIQLSQDSIDAPLPQNGKIREVSLTLTDSTYSDLCTVEVSDPDIASCRRDGSTIYITPKKPGTTTLTVKSTLNDNNSDTAQINVTGVAVQTADADASHTITLTKGQDATLSLNAYGETSDETFTWSSSDDLVASVDQNGVVTAHKAGPFTIYAKSSRSSLLNPVQGCIELEASGEGVPYLQDLTLNDYRTYGWASGDDEFYPTKETYSLTGNVSSFYFTPVFDSDKQTGVVEYQDTTGKTVQSTLTSGKVCQSVNYLVAGENTVKIILTDKEDADNSSTYTFTITKPYSATTTVTGMYVYPDGLSASSYPLYKGNQEGTIFRNLDGQVSSTTGWSQNVYHYDTYVFADTTNVNLSPIFGDQFEKVKMYVNGEDKGFVYSTRGTATSGYKTSDIAVGTTGDTTTVEFKVVSSQKYADDTAAGTDPYQNPEATYTLTIHKVEADSADMKVTSASADNGSFYAPGFSSDSYSQSLLINGDATSSNFTFTVPNGYKVTTSNSSWGTKTEISGTAGDTETTYTVNVSTPNASNNMLYVFLTSADGKTTYSYTFNFNRKGTEGVSASSIVEYLCLGSQYTNSSSYGRDPEKTLIGTADNSSAMGGSVLSLGNFGGSITYKFDTPITDDPTNPYGIDMIIQGNAFADMQGASEPGWVQVSQDGVNWYYLAGSVHYDDEADWNYTMTYTKTASGKSAWTASDGTSGENYNYPNSLYYPYYSWNDENQNSLTVSGLHLVANSKDPYGSSAAAYPDFGYVDTHSTGSYATADNPYDGNTAKKDGMFDLEWAVDADGNPVKLDSVQYVKVGTASNIYAGAIGEKSTEVRNATATKNKADSDVGVTEAPSSITVAGTKINLTSDTNQYEVLADGAFDVSVDAPADANVYINGQRTTTRSYEALPTHRTIRVIVQQGEASPYIAYIDLKTPDEAAVETVEAAVNGLKDTQDLTLDDAQAVRNAADAYDNLTDDQKAAFPQESLDKLNAAKDRISALEAD
ncbi:MAG: Ig-like domain-containing protein [Eubacteriaceae bacterium]|jgi:hypothetical protein